MWLVIVSLERCICLFWYKRGMTDGFCFTSEPGEVLCYNEVFGKWDWSFFIAADNLEQFHFLDYWFYGKASLLVAMYWCNLSDKNVADWMKYSTNYNVCYRV